jgi:hypothetical protein
MNWMPDKKIGDELTFEGQIDIHKWGGSKWKLQVLVGEMGVSWEV